MASKTGLTIIKKFTYRGDANEEFSNTYHFTGDVPADSTAWRSLFDDVVDQEKTLFTSEVSIIRGYGYDSDADDATAVWSVDLTVSPETPVAGTLSAGTTLPVSGDVAFWVRWKTDRVNSKGKPIYLRKYFHGARMNASGDANLLATSQHTAALAFATALADGTVPTGEHITARTHDDTILSSGCSTYLTTRTLKRRGKRPGA